MNEEIKVLLPRYRALMRLIIRGWRVQDAANELGYSASRASTIVNSKVFQEEFKRMEDTVDEKVIESMVEVKDDLKRKGVDAVRVLGEALKDTNAQARIRAAAEILDRAGVAKEEKLRVDATVDPSPAFVEMLARAFKEGKVGPKSDSDNSETPTK